MGKCPKNDNDMSEEPGVSLKKLPLANLGQLNMKIQMVVVICQLYLIKPGGQGE